MLASAVGAGLLVGAATGGTWRRLGEVRLRWMPIFVAAVALHIAAVLPIGAALERLAYVVSLWVLVAVAARNLPLPGAWLVVIGIGANALAITVSGGAMPVSSDAVAAAGARVPTDPLHQLTATPLALGDVIPVPVLGVYSLGDVVLALGVLVFIVWTMRGR